MDNNTNMELNICHLYPDLMNLYGDRGNIVCMKKRLEWRGIRVNIAELPVGGKVDFTAQDLFFIGGGQNLEQELVLNDAVCVWGNAIREAVEADKVFLAICSGYQLMGKFYRSLNGEHIECVGAADFYTVNENKRMIGNYAFETEEAGLVVGFENHSGATYLGEGLNALGKIKVGSGNNGKDGGEGVRYRNLFGTYSHGPVLPKNPRFCDLLLLTALKQKYGIEQLAPLDDAVEERAHQYMAKRLLAEKA